MVEIVISAFKRVFGESVCAHTSVRHTLRLPPRLPRITTTWRLAMRQCKKPTILMLTMWS
ncbi:MAG: hypothetical protein F4Y82_05865 [Cenarchaeum sp. SB0665_bin_23]|nr:hypothetical protein [Cenarchaeum sp. SB0665_bin_23]MYB47613.1 hypothetical protein [Cenarchaeum sp. SB0662_bin_33]MYG33109.1 hypothetical protein [Cenarchaeum sp. SB0677_bin_16]